MSIYKINSNLPMTQKFELLNKMILELNGKLGQANFDINEISTMYTDLSPTISRKYNRGVLLGNALGTYSNWTHVKAESGYSIWKYPVTDYAYNDLNALYVDDVLLDSRGSAGAEASTAFTKVFTYDGSYNDVTTEAGTENGTEFEFLATTDDYLYLGNAGTFSGVSFELQTRASGVTLAFEYYNGSIWTTLTVVDNSNALESDGYFTFTIPGDWAASSVNSSTQYWIRIKTTTTPVIAPKAYLAIPYNSVPALLSMSSSQIFNEEWAWCYYNGAIYVTIRNTGNTNYEGNYYINSASSNTNKQNYFIYNHTFKSDHRNEVA